MKLFCKSSVVFAVMISTAEVAHGAAAAMSPHGAFGAPSPMGLPMGAAHAEQAAHAAHTFNSEALRRVYQPPRSATRSSQELHQQPLHLMQRPAVTLFAEAPTRVARPASQRPSQNSQAPGMASTISLLRKRDAPAPAAEAVASGSGYGYAPVDQMFENSQQLAEIQAGLEGAQLSNMGPHGQQPKLPYARGNMVGGMQLEMQGVHQGMYVQQPMHVPQPMYVQQTASKTMYPSAPLGVDDAALDATRKFASPFVLESQRMDLMQHQLLAYQQQTVAGRVPPRQPTAPAAPAASAMFSHVSDQDRSAKAEHFPLGAQGRPASPEQLDWDCLEQSEVAEATEVVDCEQTAVEELPDRLKIKGEWRGLEEEKMILV